MTGRVKPVEGHALAVVRIGQEAVGDLLVGAGGGVGQEGIDFGKGRGEAGEVEGDAADQRLLVGRWRQL